MPSGTSYGGWNGPVRIFFNYSYEVYDSYAQVSVTAYMELASTYSSNGTYPVYWSGTWGTSNNSQYHNFSGAVPIVTWGGRINLAYGSTTPIAFGATGHNYWGSAGHTLSLTLPARKYSKPRPPKSPAASRSSDTQINTSWTTDYTGANGAQPWTGVYIDRWDVVSNAYKRVASVGWATTSWSDRTVKADNRYRYRFAAYNAAGQSSWVYSGYVATTPAAPTAVSASKTGTNIIVKWKNNAKYQTGAIIYDNDVQVGTVGAGVSTFTHSNPSTTTTHTYKVRATVTGPSLQSSLSTPSNTVQLLAKPNPPTNLATDKLYYGTLSDFVTTLSWQHNPVDSSTQTNREIQFTTPSNPTWVTANATQAPGALTAEKSTMGFLNLDPSLTTGAYQFRVRTKGGHADWSNWSAPITIYLEADPSITFNLPEQDQTIDRSRVRTEWAYSSDANRPQASIDLKLYRGSTVVWSFNNDYADNFYDIPYPLLDDTTYRLTIMAYSSTGIPTNQDIVDFRVDYAEPAPAGVETQFLPDKGANLVQIINPELPIPAVLNRVYRNITQDSKYMALEAPQPPASVTNLVPVSDFEIVEEGQTYSEVEIYKNYLDVPTPGHDSVSLNKWKISWRISETSMPTDLATDDSYRFQVWDKGVWVGHETYLGSPFSYLNTDQSAISGSQAMTVTAKVGFRESRAQLQATSVFPVKLSISFYGNPGQLLQTFTAPNYTNLGHEQEALLQLQGVVAPAGTRYFAVNFVVGLLTTNSQGIFTLFPGVAVTRGHRCPGPFDGVNAWGDPDMQIKWEDPLKPYASKSIVFGYAPFPVGVGTSVQAINGKLIRSSRGSTNGNASARLIPTGAPGVASDTYLYIQGVSPTPTAQLMGKPVRYMIDVTMVDEGKPLPTRGPIGIVAQRHGINPLEGHKALAPEYSQRHVVIDSVISGGPWPVEPQPNISFLLQYPASEGDPDLYLDSIAYYEGDLADYAFTGDTIPENNTIDGYPVEFVWNGPPGMSTSSMNVSWPEMIDDEWELIGEFPPNTEFYDYEGLTNGRTVYLIDAVSEIPSLSRVSAYVQADDPYLWIGSGPQYGQTAALPYNLAVSETVEHPQSQAIHFDGMDLPTLITGNARLHKLSVTGKTDPDFVKGMTWEDFLLMASSTGVVVYRDKWARRYYARLSEFAIEHISTRNKNISFGVEEVAKPIVE